MKNNDYVQEMEAFLQKESEKNNKNLNEEMFALYAELIQPVRIMENEATACGNAKRKMNEAKNLKWGKVVWFVLIFGIAFISYVIADGVKSVTGSEEISSFVLWVCIALGMVAIGFSKKKDKETRIKKQEEIYNLHNQEFEKIKKQISSKLTRIPQQYWNSYALEFFVNEYRSGKVDTVREAMQAYDTHCHRLRMEQKQQQIIQQNNQLIQNQVALENQMRRDTDDILLSMFLR